MGDKAAARELLQEATGHIEEGRNDDIFYAYDSADQHLAEIARSYIHIGSLKDVEALLDSLPRELQITVLAEQVEYAALHEQPGVFEHTAPRFATMLLDELEDCAPGKPLNYKEVNRLITSLALLYGQRSDYGQMAKLYITMRDTQDPTDCGLDGVEYGDYRRLAGHFYRSGNVAEAFKCVNQIIDPAEAVGFLFVVLEDVNKNPETYTNPRRLEAITQFTKKYTGQLAF
jgi:hypothetical protein